MKQWIVFCVLATTLLTFHGRASAQDIGQLAEATAADKLALPGLQTDMNAKTSENERLKKEYDIYADQLKSRVGPMVTNYNARTEKHNQYSQNVNSAVARFNASCHGTLPKPAYERCMGEKSQLQGMINRVNSEKSTLDAEKSRLAAEKAKYVTAMDGLAGRMKANFAAWEQLKARSDQMRKKIASAQATLVDRCKNASASERSSPQFIKYCASFGFDNPNRDLRPLDESKATQGTPSFR